MQVLAYTRKVHDYFFSASLLQHIPTTNTGQLQQFRGIHCKNQPEKFEANKRRTYRGKDNLFVRVDGICLAVRDVFHPDGSDGTVRGGRVREEDTRALRGREDVEVGCVHKGSDEGASRVATGLVVYVDCVDGERNTGGVATSQIVNLTVKVIIDTLVYRLKTDQKTYLIDTNASNRLQ